MFSYGHKIIALIRTKSRTTHWFFPCLLLTGLIIVASCGKGLGFLEKEIRNYGYIPYTTPLEHSGPGTLIGGSPQHLNLVASPQTCFPEEIDGVSTDLRRLDRTSIPKKEIRVNVSGDFKVHLFNFLQTGNPVIRAGSNFNVVHSIDLEMTGVHIEYLDSIKLTEFYRNHMTGVCKDYLDKVGFIIQAIKVEKLTFRFYNKAGHRIYFEMQNLENIVDIDANINWEIYNRTELVITTPKYIGYQLGSLRLHEEGMVLYRASEVKHNKFYFRPINIFKDINSSGPAVAVNDVQDDLELDGEWEGDGSPASLQSIDAHSIYDNKGIKKLLSKIQKKK